MLRMIIQPTNRPQFAALNLHKGLYRRTYVVKSRYIGDGHPTFNRNPYNGAL